jgi:N-acylglucosamine 2-epimerase
MMNADNPTELIRQSGQLYRETLLNDIVPFWMRHGYDEHYGGISNVLDDAGNALNHDKYLWSQGRALWTFSALYHRVEKRAEWKDFADHIYNYLATHGRDAQGKWMYRLDAQGNVLEHDISIYVDGFVLNGLAEYYAVTKHKPALHLALETYRNVSTRLKAPGSYGVAPYTIPQGMKTHGVAMIFSFFFNHLGQVAQRPDIQQHGLQLAHEILVHFYVPDKDAILEFVAIDGSPVDSPEGRACVPGHAIEAMWFLLSIFEQTNDTERMKMCCRLIRRHLQLAWDDVYGGLRLALDIDGQEPPFWKNPEGKPWWVQVEALVATAYVYAITGESWCLEWHRKVQQYAFSHYPVATGEWTQWLDRAGNKTQSSALAVKDPFHLPRGLIYLIDLFERRLPETR